MRSAVPTSYVLDVMANASPKATNVPPARRSLRAPCIFNGHDPHGGGGTVGQPEAAPPCRWSVRDAGFLDDRPPQVDLFLEPLGVRLRRRVLLGRGRAAQFGQ